MAFKLQKILSDARLPLSAAIGLAVAAISWTLMYLVATLYYAVYSFFAGGDLSESARAGLGNFMATWGLPALLLLVAALAAAWLVRRTRAVTAWQGLAVGLFSAAGIHAIGLVYDAPTLREVILYPLAGMVGGYLGSRAGRAALTEREVLYRASSAIASSKGPAEIAAAIGENLSEAAEHVTLWAVASREANGGSPELEMLGYWPPHPEPPAAPTRLDAGRMPALAGLGRLSARVVRRRELPASERGAWERRGVRSALLIPLVSPGEGPDGLLAVYSRARRDFSWSRVRAFQTVGAQAALALENLRLVQRARESGELGERQRLAREIHDTLIQGFASIAMNVQAAEGPLGPGVPAPARRHLDEALRTARESLAEARRIVWALRPEMLEDASLPEALARLAGQWSEAGVPADVTVTGETRRLPPEIEATLLRAAQEALTNVRKHAGAGRVVLTLSYMEDRVTLDVKDDGVGFEPALRGPEGPDGGYGLKAMRERVEHSDGTLTVESEPGAGTTLVVELPAGADAPSGRSTPEVLGGAS